MMLSWALLRLNPQLQTRYIDHVEEHVPDVETYFPIYEKVTRPHGRRRPVVVTRPVYPGYLFTKLNLEGRDVYLMVNLPIRARFIKLEYGGAISTIPDRVIAEIRRLESLHLLVKETHRISPFKRGVKVRVHTPIASLNAIVIALMKGNRVKVEGPLGDMTVPIHQVSVIGGQI